MATIYGTSSSDTITSGTTYNTDGNDEIFGYDQFALNLSEDGDDLINGGLGNDTIRGGTGIDNINGGEGDDTLSAGPNAQYTATDYSFNTSDFIDGGTGTDTVLINYQSIVSIATGQPFAVNCLFSAAGAAQVILNGIFYAENIQNVERASIYTGGADDIIGGTRGDDIINVGNGDDVVDGSAGNDTISDALGTIDIDGGAGTADKLNLYRGADTLAVEFSAVTGLLRVGGVNMGSAVNVEQFVVSGGSAGDTLTGNGNIGQYYGLDGNDTINGGSGNETIQGGFGDDILNGGGGNDIIEDGFGKDSINAGAGDDLVNFYAFGFFESGESYIGGSGTDRLDFNFSSVTSFNLSTATISGFETATLANWLYATDYTVTMSSAQLGQFTSVELAKHFTNRMTIKLSDNGALNFAGEVINFITMQLADGGQTISFDGASVGTLSINSEKVLGGTGNDFITGYDIVGKRFTATGGAGNDTMIGKASSVSFDGGAGNDIMRGGTGLSDGVGFSSATTGVVVDLRKTGQQNTGDGLDTISGMENLGGSNFNDTLIGNTANNFVSGGFGGNDTLQGLGGADQLFGGDGLDTASYSLSKAGVRVTLSSTGTFSLATGGDAAGDTANSIENLTGSGFVDVLIGNAAANVLTGNAGNDTLNGDSGNDRLNGGTGFDVVIGGKGRDTLTGGSNSDDFRFARGDSGQTEGAMDRITDFAKGAVNVGDEFDFSSVLTIGGSAAVATATSASINQSTGIATFAAGSGATMADALSDIATRMTSATNSLGEFAVFRVGNTGAFHVFVSDGVAGVGPNDVLVQLTNITSIGSINLTGGDLTILA